MLEKIVDDDFVFVDEAGFSVTMRPHHGYSESGTPVVISSPGLRSRNISICLAMTKYDVLNHETNLQAYNVKDLIIYI